MNTKSKHTPGPWTVSSAGKFLAVRKSEGIPVLLVTMTEHLPINGIDQAANARLIAAAPDLLEAAMEALALLNMIGMRYANDPSLREAKEITAPRRALSLAVSRAMGSVYGGNIPDMDEAAALLKKEAR